MGKTLKETKKTWPKSLKLNLWRPLKSFSLKLTLMETELSRNQRYANSACRCSSASSQTPSSMRPSSARTLNLWTRTTTARSASKSSSSLSLTRLARQMPSERYRCNLNTRPISRVCETAERRLSAKREHYVSLILLLLHTHRTGLMLTNEFKIG